MTNDPFAHANLAFLGGQIAQVWQRTLDAWWRTLLGDSKRLSELARELAKQRPLSSARNNSASPADLADLVQALELLEQRLKTAEGLIGPITRTPAISSHELAGLVQALESMEQRLTATEQRVTVLAETTTRILDHLESKGNDR